MSHEVHSQKVWHPNKLPEITYHEACTKPEIHSEADFARLLEDVKVNGIVKPILVQKSSGAVVCGRGRIKAAKEGGCPIPVNVLDISDAECWALSKSELAHRHLSPSRAMNSR